MSKKVWNSLFLGIFLSTSIFAADVYVNHVKSLPSGSTFGAALAEIGGTNYALVGRSYDLIVADISDISSPVEIASIDLGGPAHGMDIVGATAYIALGDSGMAIVDISTPSAPVVKSTLMLDGQNARGLEVSGNHAYVAVDFADVMVVDVSDVTNPQKVGASSFSGRGYSVAVGDGGDVFAAAYNGNQRVLVLDVADPANPTIKASRDMRQYAVDIDVSGDFIYVAANFEGFLVFDVSDPANPDSVAAFNQNMGKVSTILADGGVAYTLDPDSGLVISNVSDPTNPSAAGLIETAELPERMDKLGNYVIVAEGMYGAEIFDVSDPSSPTLAGTIRSPGIAYDVAVVDNYAILGIGNFGVQIADVSDASAASYVQFFNTNGAVLGVTVAGDTIGLADGDVYSQILHNQGEFTYDPDQTGGVFSSATDVVIEDNKFYLSTEKGLQLVVYGGLFQKSFSPKGKYLSSGEAQAVDKVGDIAYLAEGDSGISILDVSSDGGSSEYNFPELSRLPFTTGSAHDIKVKGGYAFVAGGMRGLMVIDVSDPAAPALTKELSLGDPTFVRAQQLAISNDTAYIAAMAKIVLVDISDPMNPSIIASGDAADQALAVTPKDGFLYTAEGLSGLGIYKLSGEPSQMIVRSTAADGFGAVGRVWLNRSTLSYTLTRQATVSVKILDMSGRVVNSVPSSHQHAGLYEIGTQELTPGFYCLKLRANDAEMVKVFSVFAR